MSIRPIILAFSFLTRLPVPALVPEDDELGRSMMYYPFVGAILGIGLWVLSVGAGMVLSPVLTAVCTLFILGALTGGLHLDGVADCFDALGVFGDRERRLAVMKDPRVGALGAAGLFGVMLLKVFALAEIDPIMLVPALACARWLSVIAVVGFPYARNRGTGRALADQTRWSEVAVGALFTIPMILLAGPLAGWGVVGAGVAAGCVAWRMNRALGGLTGDVYGAIIEAAEVGFFLSVAIAAG
ncbi:MAG: adenosylcobinamide-GDP ribazoletransferase [Myxococcota bacterium]